LGHYFSHYAVLYLRLLYVSRKMALEVIGAIGEWRFLQRGKEFAKHREKQSLVKR